MAINSTTTRIPALAAINSINKVAVLAPTEAEEDSVAAVAVVAAQEHLAAEAEAVVANSARAQRTAGFHARSRGIQRGTLRQYSS